MSYPDIQAVCDAEPTLVWSCCHTAPAFVGSRCVASMSCAARRQNSDNKEAERTEQDAVRSQITYGGDGIGIRYNDTGVFQPHHGDKQADTHRNANAQAQRNISNHPVAHAQQRQDQQSQRAPENSALYMPRIAHRPDNHKGEKGV